MKEEKEIIEKMFEWLAQAETDSMNGLHYNEQYHRGYSDALFWVVDKELHEVNEVLKEMGLIGGEK